MHGGGDVEIRFLLNFAANLFLFVCFSDFCTKKLTTIDWLVKIHSPNIVNLVDHLLHSTAILIGALKQF